MKIVIRAGGGGTRLWPMSRQNFPKQFQPVAGDQTMIRATYERLKDLAQNQDIFVFINQEHETLLRQILPEILEKNIIRETAVRNTGPAMCLEVCYLLKFCQPQEIIASLPADDYIAKPSAFGQLLKASEEFLQSQPDYIITPAVRPGYPDTGYSYLKIGQLLSEQTGPAIYRVAVVVEKPNQERCQELIDSGNYYCHAGMYIWQLGAISQLFQKFQPAMFKICSDIVEMMIKAEPDWPSIAQHYGQLEKMSIETAITNQAEKIAMSVSDQVGWSDLGKWHIIKHLLSAGQDNLTKGEVLCQQAKNNLVYNNNNKKLIAVLGVNDLVVVDTRDVLLITSLEKSGQVKELVEELKKQNKLNYL